MDRHPTPVPVGIMQGRLSPPEFGRIQSFPAAGWQAEFSRAREAGLVSIEWIYETGTDLRNPLLTDEGVGEILERISETGIQVYSICADFFMNELLLDEQGNPRPAVVDHLLRLLGRASKLHLRYMVLPFVDSSSLVTPAHLAGLRKLLPRVLSEAERVGIEIHLETDLRPQVLAALYREFDHDFLRANYDIGNSAALGYDPEEELSLLAPWLGSVHVKDRIRGGGTVPLGKGSANFQACFRHFRAAGFRNPYILQVARETGISETELARRNRVFVETMVRSQEE